MEWIAAGIARAEPAQGLLGGLMIGTAAAMMLVGLGRIAGVGGLVAKLFAGAGRPAGSATIAGRDAAAVGTERLMAMAFLAGLPGGGALAAIARGGGLGSGGLAGDAAPSFAAWPLLVVAGLLVGFGTRLGSGCTSGHGVCGVSRWSARSVVATLVFIATGMGVVAGLRAVAPHWLVGVGA